MDRTRIERRFLTFYLRSFLRCSKLPTGAFGPKLRSLILVRGSKSYLTRVQISNKVFRKRTVCYNFQNNTKSTTTNDEDDELG